jgi:hypothetical protein
LYVDKQTTNNKLAQVPILDIETNTIAGIRIGSFKERIPDNLRPAIRAALEKLKFHIKLEPNPTEEEKQSEFLPLL